MHAHGISPSGQSEPASASTNRGYDAQRLADKVSRLTESETAKLIAAAEDKVGGLQDVIYKEIGLKLVGLRVAFGKVAQCPGDNREALVGLCESVFNAKGLGGTVGFDLISQIGESLWRYLKKLDVAGEHELTVIRHHLDALSAVWRGSVKGSGGDMGKELLDTLNKAAETCGTPS